MSSTCPQDNDDPTGALGKHGDYKTTFDFRAEKCSYKKAATLSEAWVGTDGN